MLVIDGTGCSGCKLAYWVVSAVAGSSMATSPSGSWCCFCCFLDFSKPNKLRCFLVSVVAELDTDPTLSLEFVLVSELSLALETIFSGDEPCFKAVAVAWEFAGLMFSFLITSSLARSVYSDGVFVPDFSPGYKYISCACGLGALNLLLQLCCVAVCVWNSSKMWGSAVKPEDFSSAVEIRILLCKVLNFAKKLNLQGAF